MSSDDAVFHVRFMTENDTPCLYITDTCVFATGRPSLPYDLEGLEMKLQALPLDEYPGLHVFFEAASRDLLWQSLNPEKWLKFCQVIQQHVMKTASGVEIMKAHHMGDDKCSQLLQHFSSATTVTSACISGSIRDIPLTIRQVGSFSTLQELQIKCEQRVQTPSFIPVAIDYLLKRMPQLTVLVLRNVGATQGGPTWQPAFDRIRHNHRFTRVELADSGLAKDVEAIEPLQYGPRLHAARKKYLSKPKISREKFVEALISVRDRFDCLHHLLSTADPGWYA